MSAARLSCAVLSALLAAVVTLMLVGGSATAAGGQTGPPSASDVAAASPRGSFVPGEVVVRFEDGVGETARAAALAEHDPAERRSLPELPNVELVRLGTGRGVEAAVAALQRRPEVRYAEPNVVYQVAAVPNDTRWSELWGLNAASDKDIDAPEAWDTTTGSANVVVGVIDTGMAYDHPDLAPNLWTNPGETGGGKETNGVDDDGNGRTDDWRGWDFAQNDNDPRDGNGHGTHVAGTIGAKGNNGYGVVGVNWTVKLMPLKVFGPSGGATSANMAAAAAYAAAKGAKVVNMSIQCLGAPCYAQVMKDAIDAAGNTLFAVAAGNSNNNNDTTPDYPCNYDSANLICVAATDQNDNRAGFSSYGATSVDLAAPGTSILSTWPDYDSLFTDNLETDFLKWTIGGTPPGTPATDWKRTSERAASGSFSATDSEGGNYGTSQNKWMRNTTAVNLSGRVGCSLNYQIRLQTESAPNDILWIDRSTDAVSWTAIQGWFGTTGGFIPLSTDLTTLQGSSTAYFRFRLQTNASIVNDGIHLDDIDLRCVASPYGTDAFNSIQGTSMATPHVAGVAALAWAANPAATVAQMRTAILGNVDVVPALSGLVATGGRLNAQKVIASFVAPPVMCLGSPATITGTAGDDTLVGTAGNDVIVGLTGQDVFVGGDGDDKMCGGDGHDSLDYRSSVAPVNVNLTTGAVTGQGSDTVSDIESGVGSPFNDTMTGNSGPNAFNGQGGNDVLSGMAGTDTLLGAEGNDTLRGGLDNDSLNGGDGTADKGDFSQSATGVTANLTTNVATGEGNDTFTAVENLTGSNQIDTLTGNGGNNELIGFGGNDTLNGEGGADSLLGRLGDDQVNGGTGTDTGNFAQSPSGVTATTLGATGEGTDTFTGIENLSGSPQADNLSGDTAVNVLVGAGGNDTLNGGDGPDNLRGSGGDDTLNGDAGNDTGDWSSAPGSMTVTLGAPGSATGEGTDTLSSIENVGGSIHNDTITGDANGNLLVGGPGNDTVDGGDGNDTLRGRGGNDDLDGQGGTGDVLDATQSSTGVTIDLVAGTAVSAGEGNDTVAGIENVSGSPFNDTITGSAGPNVVGGGAGIDTIDAGMGNDIVRGGLGNDNLNGGGNVDYVDFQFAPALVTTTNINLGTATGEGTDALSNFENLIGSAFNDVLNGSNLANRIEGRGGDDVINGLDGNDNLIGGDGTDTLDGGNHTDTCDGETESNCEI